MTATISRLYDNYADAQKAVQGLEAAGVPHSDISIVANNSDNWYSGNKVDRDRDGVDDRAEGAGKGAGIGAGDRRRCRLAGWPGPARDSGPWPGGGGRLAGGNGGRRCRWRRDGRHRRRPYGSGRIKEEAPLYAEGVRRGGTLVSARVPDADRARLETILSQSAVNLQDRSAAWQKTGWQTFDPASKPYGANEIQRERQLYGSKLR